MKSDESLQQDVLAELKWEPAVDAASVGVECKDGIVTLSGHVDTYLERWAAERAAQRVAGVRGLAVEIVVKPVGDHRRSDPEIAQAARHALDWNASIPRESVQVVVRDGHLTLSGHVGWSYQRDAATATVRNLVGVVHVDNEIRIRPKSETRDVKEKIRAAFHRLANLDSSGVVVEVHGDEVVLSGDVATFAEKAAAHDAAWAAPGIASVVDRIRILG